VNERGSVLDFMDIGPSPTDEDCAQVGDPDYREKARAECKRFIEVIRQKLGPEPFGARLRVKWQSHDFGSYAEVVCEYTDTEEEAVAYAFRCEAETPTTWTDTGPVKATT